MSAEVKRTERGWAGHYILGDKCKFHRNTLLECGTKKWIVSTIGGLITDDMNVVPIGANRWYETMAFEAKCKDGYWEADVEKEISFDGEWGLCAESFDTLIDIYPYPDNVANAMHERVVDELCEKIIQPVRPYLTIDDLRKYPNNTRIYIGGYDECGTWNDFKFAVDDVQVNNDGELYFVIDYNEINRSDR